MGTRYDTELGPCPECGTPNILVTYVEQIGGQGQVTARAPFTVPCTNPDCPKFDPRTRREDANQAAARTVREATEGK